VTTIPSAHPPSLPPPPALDPAAFRRLAHAAVDLVADHLGGIRERPVFAPMTPGQRAALLEQPLPDHGVAPETLLTLVAQQVFGRDATPASCEPSGLARSRAARFR
jgi:hypothetical protein